MSKKIKIKSTVYPSNPASTFQEWTEWLIAEHKRRWTKKIRSGYAQRQV